MAAPLYPEKVTLYSDGPAAVPIGTPGNPLSVSSSGASVGGTYTDRSGTITLGGTSQQVAAAAATRSYFFISNPSDTDAWVNVGVAAVANQPSIFLAANGGYWEPRVPPVGAINIIGATTGKAFTAKEII